MDPNLRTAANAPFSTSGAPNNLPADSDGSALDPSDQQQKQQPQSKLGQVAGGLHDQWNSFIDHPESRAGLMQFAVNMLSGRGFGESLGGAAEAMGRNVTAQQTQEQEEEKLAQQERIAGAHETTAQAALIRAQRGDPADRYYNQAMVKDQLAAKNKKFDLFHTWLNKDDLTDDTYMAYLKGKYPGVNKKDLVNPQTPQAKAAQADILDQFDRYGSSGGGRGGGVGTPVYDKQTGALKGYWDGKKFTAGGPE